MGRRIVDDKKINTAFTLSPSSVKLLDENRGKESRSSFVDQMLQSLKGVEV